MPTDIYLDLVTRDYVPTADGDWTEQNNSRTAVILQLECEYNAWWGDPESGSRIKAMLRSGDPVTPQEMKAECTRALGKLVQDGMIADLVVNVDDFDPAAGALAVRLTWWDRAGNSPVDLIYTPSGGVPR